MKTITIVFLLICNVCIGQHKDSIWKTYQYLNIVDSPDVDVFYYSTMDSTLVINDSLRTIKWLIGLTVDNMKNDNRYSFYHTKDTVQVLMQVSDTAVIEFTTEIIKVDKIKDILRTLESRHENIYNNEVKWVYGYLVDSGLEIKYLNSEKLPFKKSIIIWQVKELNGYK